MSAATLKGQIPDASGVAKDLYSIDFRNGVARCPFPGNHNHGDREPSLRFDRRKDRVFCASQNCFGEKGADAIGLVQRLNGCDFKAAVQTLTERYGVPVSDRSYAAAHVSYVNGKDTRGSERTTPAEKVREGLRRKGFLPVAEIPYGASLRKVKFEHKTKVQTDKNRPEKTFRWEHLCDGIWYAGDGGISKPLYVNSVFQSRDQTEIVLGFEGEAKADMAGDLAFAGFSFKDLTDGQAAEFAGYDVVLWPDNDDSGQKQAESAAEVIARHGHARTIKIVVPRAEFPPAGDIIDVIAELSWDRQRIAQFLETAKPYKSDRPDEVVGTAAEPAVDAPGRVFDSKAGGKHFLPSRFRVSDDGVFCVKEQDHGTSELIRVSARLDVVAETRDGSGNNWGRLLRWRDNEGRVHQWSMPMELLASDASAVRSRLLGEGLPFIITNARLRERFTEYLQSAAATRRMLCVSRVGWHDGTYVLPEESVGPEEGEEILYQTHSEAVHHWKVRGTADEWRDQVGRRCAGNSRLIVAVSCGFAGPLFSIAGAESGGVHFHGASSTGKTTALIVGGSVCGGGGQAGFVQTWRTTINGLEAIAEAHNDGTLFLDELAQVDPREAAETAYMLANGQGKSRMTRTLCLRRKPAWTVLVVSAGELTLAEHAASAGKRTKGGAEVRLLNIQADAGHGLGMFEALHESPSPEIFVGQMRAAALHHYGAPYREYLKRLVRDRAAVERMIGSARHSFNAVVPEAAAGQVQRAADRFSLIAAAGELATAWGLTGWREGEAIKAAQQCFGSWIVARNTAGDSDVEAGIRQVQAFFGLHGNSRFQVMGRSLRTNTEYDNEDDERIVRDRAGFRRRNPKTAETEYLIFPETFRTELCAGFDYRTIARELDNRGLLLRHPPSMMIKPRLPEMGPTWVYGIRAAILEGDGC